MIAPMQATVVVQTQLSPINTVQNAPMPAQKITIQNRSHATLSFVASDFALAQAERLLPKTMMTTKTGERNSFTCASKAMAMNKPEAPASKAKPMSVIIPVSRGVNNFVKSAPQFGHLERVAPSLSTP